MPRAARKSITVVPNPSTSPLPLAASIAQFLSRDADGATLVSRRVTVDSRLGQWHVTLERFEGDSSFWLSVEGPGIEDAGYSPTGFGAALRFSAERADFVPTAMSACDALRAIGEAIIVAATRMDALQA